MGYSDSRRKRAKRQASKKKSFVNLTLDDEDDDVFPDLLVKYIEQLPDGSGSNGDDESDERPAKRTKTADIASGYFVVARKTLTFSQPRRRHETIPGTQIFRSDVGPYLKLRFAETESTLTITAKEKFQNRTPRTVLAVCDLTESDKLLLKIAEKNAAENLGPGHFWVSMDLRLREEVGAMLLDFILELRWNESVFVSGDVHTETQKDLRDRVLEMFLPEIHQQIESSNSHGQESQSPQDFYEAAYVPSQDDSDAAAIEVPRLTAELYPFQRRAVQWLLSREGARWVRKGPGDMPGLVPLHHDLQADLSAHFVEARDCDGKTFYVSGLFGIATKDPAPFRQREAEIKGGILSEEMGLGKTVEMISLMLLHRRPSGLPPTVFDNRLGAVLRPTGATLIVTPPTLKEQWLSELNRHAPHLKVVVYAGIGKSCKDESAEAAMVTKLTEHDVVVTTYNELKNELHFALDPPDRAFRGVRKHHRPKSPLVQVSWWRVCLDEAQEIESGVSNAATLARLIPRVNAWGVTGTPVKDGVKDLWGLLLFLHYDPYASVPRVWHQLATSYKDVFRNLFNRIALRHTKRLVRDELALPPQKRYILTMPFTAVEEQHYQSLFRQLAESCGLGPTGEPIKDDWDPEDPAVLEAMRTALDRLRQTTLHPEIGVRNRRALGRGSGPMRTVEEVLDAMIENSQNAITSDYRALLQAKLTRGQLLENSPRVKEALTIWEGVLSESDAMVQQCREHLQAEMERAKSSEGQAMRVEDDEENEDPDKAVGRVGDAQRRLRHALEVQHRAIFFCANAHYQIKSDEEEVEPDSDEFKRLEQIEVDLYDRAKIVRNEILRDTRHKVTQIVERLAAKASHQNFVEIPEFALSERRGLESRLTLDTLEGLGYALDRQAEQIDEWREKIIQLLLSGLVDEEEDVELTGDEYGDSTKTQEDLIAYITFLRVVVADRQKALAGLSLSKLTQDEIMHSVQLAREGDGPSPEKMLALFYRRERRRPDNAHGSVRAAIAELRDLTTRLTHQIANDHPRARLELEIAQEHLTGVQAELTRHTKIAAALEQEIDKFTVGMNARVAYYRQLQAVSDMVAPYEGPTDETKMAALLRDEAALEQKLESSRARHRFLLHLKQTDSKEEQRMCVICRSSFTIGVLTVCGHQFCKECITLWFRAHHNCPMCKRRLTEANLHDITLKPQELKVRSENSGRIDGSDSQLSPRSKKTGIYASFNPEKLAEIKNIDLPGPSYTTKVDTLIRHLMWLRESDPGSKSIVFSQYADFLQVLAVAFRRHQIGFTSIYDPEGVTTFKEDPGMECFLLHARAHSSGLNLVNASHVILCEPLLNTALELQAIARVDRIGQQHETTVWLYIVDGTVEESIYNLSVQRRMEHMGRNLKGKSKESTPELLDSSLELANSMEMEQANLSKLLSKSKTSGEEIAKGDLWTCLFGAVASASSDGDEERLRNNPEIRRYLAAEAAEERRRDEEQQPAM